MDAQEQRRLLELAAKAVGFVDDDTDESWVNGLHRGSDDVFYITSSDGWREWNPAEDDGDALRLAVNLGMCVDVCLSQETWVLTGYNESINVTRHHCESDSYAATRLAIVRAAAAIGEKMEEEK